MIALVLACAEPRAERGGDEPVEVPWHADLSFGLACTGSSIALRAEAPGWAVDVPVAVDCDGIDVARAVEAVRAACASPAPTCDAVAHDVEVELVRRVEWPRGESLVVVPDDPDALPIAGSTATLEIGFVDGTSESWGNGARSWGERYVRLEPDGTLAAQGSRLFEPAEGTELGCRAVRDHTMTGRVTAPSEIELEVVEVNELACAEDVALRLDCVVEAEDRTPP